MVKFRSIILAVPEGRDLGFRTLELFDEFRQGLWEKQESPIPFQEEYTKQRNLESWLEKEHNFPEKTMRGVCLIFGTRIQTHDVLASYHARDVITDPQATATVRIETYRDNVMTRVHRNGMHYVCSFPRSHALLPAHLDLEGQYRAFAKGRVWYLDGNVLCIQ